MILNIYGPSGSGKTTLVKKLLTNNKIKIFFEHITKEKYINSKINKVSISLIPLPKFRGTVKEFFNIFSIDINILLTLNDELKKLSESIFARINDQKTLQQISMRQIETFSAGELRRLFLLKTLLADSDFMVLDEPFSNSDKKIWEIIYKAINQNNNNMIILSHISLQDLFGLDEKNKSININKVKKNFIID